MRYHTDNLNQVPKLFGFVQGTDEIGTVMCIVQFYRDHCWNEVQLMYTNDLAAFTSQLKVEWSTVINMDI